MGLQAQLSFTTLLLSVVTASISEPIFALLSPRAILSGVIAAVILSIAIKYYEQCAPSKVTRNNMQVAILLWLCAELVQIFMRAVSLCQSEFSSMALIGVAPFLFWAGWKLPLDRWNIPAKVLFWITILVGVIFLLGVAEQLRWERLFEFDKSGEADWLTPIYAEYFFLPIISEPKQESLPKSRIARLPWAVFITQCATALVFQLLFGQNDRSALEALRVWSWGSFSRMDSALLLVWLTCALLRICILCGMIHIVWKLVRKKPVGKGTLK